MNFLNIITQEETLYASRKHKLILEAQKLLGNSDQVVDHSEDIVKVQSLRQDAILMDSQVHQIQQNAHTTIKSFESLKNQKRNVEQLMNTLNCFLQLERIKNDLPNAIINCDIISCTKLGQVYYEIEPNLLKEFCQKDHQFIEDLISKDLVTFQKTQFEAAVKLNDLEKINLCSGLARVLKMDQSLSKVQEIYAKDLLVELKKLDQEAIIPTTLENYQYPFLNQFVAYLELIKPESFTLNVEQYYGPDGVLKLIDYLVSQVSHPYLVGVLKQLNNFFDIPNILASKKTVQSYDSQLLQAVSKKINLQDTQLKRISFYCEEVAEIATEYSGFIKHLQEATKLTLKLAIGDQITEYLGKYVEYAEIELQQQIINVLQKSQALNDLWNFDKSKFISLISCGILLGNGYQEWLEEIFYLIRQQISRVIRTENQIISSAIINFIGFQIISDDLYQVALQLFHRYLKREYFSSTAIGLSSEFTVNNTFMILIINILSAIPQYLKTLKSQIYSEIPKNSQMIVGAVEEMVDVNVKKFKTLIDDKLRIVADYLKQTTKNVFEDLGRLSFDAKDVVMLEQEREYQKIFSKQFKEFFNLNQWKQQLTQQNYEIMTLHLCNGIAKSLEQIVMRKKFTQVGAVMLEKEMRSSINYLVNSTIPTNKQAFQRLQFICSILLFESVKDMEEFLSSSALSEITSLELKNISQLRIDL